MIAHPHLGEEKSSFAGRPGRPPGSHTEAIAMPIRWGAGLLPVIPGIQDPHLT